MKDLLRSSSIILLLLLTNCNDVNDYKKIVNSKVLFSAENDKNGNGLLSGSHFYFDNKGNLLTDYLFITNNDSILHYEMRVRNSRRQIVYFCEYKNGEILREFDSFKFDTISKENGSFLYSNYCKYCHYNQNSIGPSTLYLSNLSKDKFLESFATAKSHDTIPKLTEKQLLSLQEFISKPSE